MQDLSSYQSEPAAADPSPTPPAAAQHRPRAMMRSKSESYNKGESTLPKLLYVLIPEANRAAEADGGTLGGRSAC